MEHRRGVSWSQRGGYLPRKNEAPRYYSAIVASGKRPLAVPRRIRTAARIGAGTWIPARNGSGRDSVSRLTVGESATGSRIAGCTSCAARGVPQTAIAAGDKLGRTRSGIRWVLDRDATVVGAYSRLLLMPRRAPRFFRPHKGGGGLPSSFSVRADGPGTKPFRTERSTSRKGTRKEGSREGPWRMVESHRRMVEAERQRVPVQAPVILLEECPFCHRDRPYGHYCPACGSP